MLGLIFEVGDMPTKPVNFLSGLQTKWLKKEYWEFVFATFLDLYIKWAFSVVNKRTVEKAWDLGCSG